MAPSTVIQLPLMRSRRFAADGLQFAREVASGERNVGVHNFLRGPGGDDVATEFACARTEIDYVIGVSNGVFIVFNHQHRVTEVTQRFEGFDQPLVVALVQTDRWFVEHIENSTQPGANLRGQPNALSFAAGKTGGIAIERQIAEADGIEKLQPLDDLAAKPFSDQALTARELDGARRVQRLA